MSKDFFSHVIIRSSLKRIKRVGCYTQTAYALKHYLMAKLKGVLNSRLFGQTENLVLVVVPSNQHLCPREQLIP